MKYKCIKKIISCLLLTTCCVSLSSSFIVKAEESWPVAPEIEGGSAIVMEVNSGAVLYEKNAHEQLYPASITKIMTGLLAIENSQLDELVTFSYDSVHKTEGSSIWRDVDEVMTMEQCLYALMLNSANECGYAIAEHTGGTYENFIQMMNDKAAELGCTDTHFNNPHGLTDEQHYTSCYDMALIGREAIQNDLFRKITGTKRYDIPPTNKHPDEITYLTNHHKMLWEDNEHYYEYCIGGKTGYTMAAGNTLVTFAEKDGMTLVSVVMKEKPQCQYKDSRALLDFCFENFKAYKISENLNDNMKIQLPENDFLAGEAFADIDETATIVLPVGAEFTDATMEIITDTSVENIGNVSAENSMENTQEDAATAGTLEFSYAGHVVGSVDVRRTAESIEEYPFEVKEEEVEEPERVIQLDIKMILLVILGIVLLGAAGFGIYKFADNFYLIRYKFYSRKQRDIRTDVIRRKKRRRRR